MRQRTSSATERQLVVVASLAPFAVIFDANAFTVALPSVGDDFGLDGRGLRWLFVAYSVTLGALLIAGGRAADRLGRRRTLRLGMALFGAATVAGALAPSLGILLGARVVLASAAALALPAAVGSIAAGFAAGPERTRALAVYGTAGSAAFVAGVVVGGAVTDLLGWRAVLLLDAAPAIAAVALARWGVPGGAGSRPPRGPLATLRGRQVLAAAAAALCTVATGTGVMFALALALQEERGLSAFEAGVVFTLLGLGGLIGAAAVRRVGVRLVPSALVAVALTVQGAGVLATAAGAGGAPVVALASALVLTGAGHFGATIAFTALASMGVGVRDQATAAGGVGMAQQLGGAVGPLVAGVALGSSGAAYPRALLVAALLSVAGAIAVPAIAGLRAQP